MAATILNEWIGTARLAQYPVGAKLRDIWLVMGGRGAGKTRLGAEWLNAIVQGFSPFTKTKYGRIALIGETLQDAREVMVEGPSGILSVSRGERPKFEPSRRRISWENGATAYLFSSEDPDSLRGPQFDAAWSDEVAKWKYADACFDMLQFGLRLGERPIQLLTTTPKPVALIKRLVMSAQVTVTRMKTSENVDHLSSVFMRTIQERYGGTLLGRQELDGLLIQDRPDALWTRANLELIRSDEKFDIDRIARIVVAVDPPASSGKSSAACGIIVAGIDSSGMVWILHDGTVVGMKPHEWAYHVVSLFHSFKADRVIAEVNQGGEMVASVLNAIDADLPIKNVRAVRGKWSRAEPIAALYEQGRVGHINHFVELEDEMLSFGPDGLSNGRSPDRVDALVWAVRELISGLTERPRIRKVH